tara:strand:- start:89 stop:1114 length:1026 start_codon:yes stop_codon:yes gene_type:complete
MNTEDFTSFFKLVNDLNIQNQTGGNSILESIETKKFSMIGAAENPNNPLNPNAIKEEKVTNTAVFKQIAELLQKLKTRLDKEDIERDKLMRSSETSSATIEQKDKTLAEKTEEVKKLKELVAQNALQTEKSIIEANKAKDEKYNKLKKEEEIHLLQIKKLEEMITTFGNDVAGLEKELTDITNVLTSSHSQVKKEVDDVTPVKEKLKEAQATLASLKTDYEKTKKALTEPISTTDAANPSQKELDEERRHKAVMAGNKFLMENLTTAGQMMKQKQEKKPDPFKPETTNNDLVKGAAVGIVEGTGLAAALQGGSEIDDLLNFTEVNSEKSSNNITDILSNLL